MFIKIKIIIPILFMQKFVLFPSIVGRVPNPIPFMSKTPPNPLSQTRTWCGGLRYTMEGKIK
jgi:hypothetical protein